jgi:hypothetical protein
MKKSYLKRQLGNAKQHRPQEAAVRPGQRSLAVSMGWAMALVGIGIPLSSTINPLLGRRVHWDWTSGLALVLFILLTLVFRQKRV